MSESAVADPPKAPPPSTALIPVPLTYEERFAGAVAKSGFVPGVSSTSQALVKIQAGSEFGIKPMQALAAFHVVEGKISMAPQAQLGILRRSGRDFRVVERSEKAAEIAFVEKDGSVRGKLRFTIEEAKKAGLVKPRGAWETYPANMLWWRAVANGIRLYYPELTLGAFYTPDELGAQVDQDGEVIDAEVVVVQKPAKDKTEESGPTELAKLRADLDYRGIDPAPVAARYGHKELREMTTDNIKHYRKTILSKL
jgi:hypothetical protein